MDWQTISVFVIISIALAYIGKLAWQKIRSFSSKSDSCETGCGKCGSSSTKEAAPKLIQISRK